MRREKGEGVGGYGDKGTLRIFPGSVVMGKNMGGTEVLMS